MGTGGAKEKWWGGGKRVGGRKGCIRGARWREDGLWWRSVWVHLDERVAPWGGRIRD